MTCYLPESDTGKYARPALMVTASNLAPNTRAFLRVDLGRRCLGVQIVSHYDHYYFRLAPGLNPGKGAKIRLRVVCMSTLDNACVPKPDLALYQISLVDLGRENTFGERNEFYTQMDVFRASHSILPEVLDQLRLTPSDTILDIGTGLGWTTFLLAANTGAKTVGLDLYRYDDPTQDNFKLRLIDRISRHQAVIEQEPGFGHVRNRERIAAIVAEQCSFFAGDAQQMHFKDDMFDFVFSLNAFEHIADPQKAMSEIARVLKPGGHALIIFHIPYYCDGGHHLHACQLLSIPWVHLLYDREQIKKMVCEAGNLPNEVDHILDSLNGCSISQFEAAFLASGLTVVKKIAHKGFTIPGAESSEEFARAQQLYPVEELTTRGMDVLLKKDAGPRSCRPNG